MQDLIYNLSNNSLNNNNPISNFEELIEEEENKNININSLNFYENNSENIPSFKSEDIESSTSIIHGTISNNLKDNILLTKIIFGNIYCSKCMIPCLIIFNSNFTCFFSLRMFFYIKFLCKRIY